MRGRWLILAFVVVAAGTWRGLAWAASASHREEWFSAPVRLVAGNRVTGSFTPEDEPDRPTHDGRYEILLKWRREENGDGPDRVGGRGNRDEPARVTLSYAVRDRGSVVHRGTTGEHFWGPLGGQTEYGVFLAHFEDGHPVPLDIEVRVDRADGALASLETRVVVAPSMERLKHDLVTVTVRRVFVLAGASLTFCVVLTLWVFLSRRAERAATAVPSGPL